MPPEVKWIDAPDGSTICPNCSEEVRPHERLCVACQTDCGFPNVRAAGRGTETQALSRRVAEAERAAADRGAGDSVQRLRSVALRSRAVRVRSLDEVYGLVSSDNRLMGTFHDLEGAGLLRPEAAEIEAARQSAEPLVFLNYHEQIQFAALVPDDRGLFGYGNCAMVLHESKIANRASVFEENCVRFCQDRELGPANPVVPPGFRATWENRDDLAVAKLATRLSADMTEEEIEALFVDNEADRVEADFIEVHVYGPIHRSALDHVVVKLTHPLDVALANALREALGEDRVRMS